MYISRIWKCISQFKLSQTIMVVLSVYWGRIANAFNQVLFNNPAGETESGTGSVERLLGYLQFKQ